MLCYVEMIDKRTGLINHFTNAYKELFLSKSILLRDLVKDKIDKVVHFLMLAFFDGIITAKIMSENPHREIDM